MIHKTWEECAERYPRIVASIQRMAVFSKPEAACAVRDYRDGKAASKNIDPFNGAVFGRNNRLIVSWGQDMLKYGGGEAVNHYGGPQCVVERAIQRRHDHKNWR